MKRFPRFVPALASLVFIVSAAAADARSVVVYSARNAHLIEPVFDLYTRETGNEVRFVTDKDPVLLQRIQAEGETTPADLLITVDAGNLWHAAREGILAPVDSAVLAAPFDSELGEVVGEAEILVRDVAVDSIFGQAQFALSRSGTLVYLPGGDRSLGTIAWIDRDGRRGTLPVEPRVYGTLDLVPGVLPE